MTPLDGTDVLFADLDGVIYTGENAVTHAVEALTTASRTTRVAYITNNASRTPESVADHLRSLGLVLDASDVVTSPQSAVRILATLVPAGSTILVVGGEGLIREVEGHNDGTVPPFDESAPDDTPVHRRDGNLAVRLGLADVRGIGSELATRLSKRPRNSSRR